MGQGGSQRVASNLINHWVKKEKTVLLIEFFPNKPLCHEVNDSVDRIFILNNSYINLRKYKKTIGNIIIKLLNVLKRAMPFTLVRLKQKNNIFIKNEGKGYIKDILIQKNTKFVIYLTHLLIDVLKIDITSVVKIYYVMSFLFIPGDFRRLRRLRSVFKSVESKCVISFLGATNIKTIMSSYGLNRRIIISERNDPNIQKLSDPWDFLRKKFYRLADVVTSNSKGSIETLKDFVPYDKLLYIPNPLTFNICSIEKKKRFKIILCVGRLVKQKSIDTLLKAFSLMYKSIPSWHILVVGEGPLKNELINLSYRLKIFKRTHFMGYRKDIYRFYKISSIFVMPSLHEGMPNSLMEAMCHEIPAIVSNSSPGPLELIKDQYNGYIFQKMNIFDLRDKIYNLVKNENLRLEMGNRHREFINDFSLNTISTHWESLIQKDI
ncbi:glycosyltransferase [Desulfosarcina widdelii]|nr:glycosyltransferase [Desulfosarcina widdelii]